MRRLALLVAGGALWLLLSGGTAVFADGGPHVASVNSGAGSIGADSCAGCHRAHTAQGSMILVQDGNALCLTCHGATGTGATTDVLNGIQYTIASRDVGTPVLGALRGGGFENARIDSSHATRLTYGAWLTYTTPPGPGVSILSAVPVRSSGQAVTSKHMDPTAVNPGLDVAWGNGTSGAGGTTELECTSCHNPHGNGQYRILNPIPAANGTGATMVAAGAAANVTDAPLPGAGDTRNYTVIQKQGTQGNNSTYLLYASDVTAWATANGVDGTTLPTVGDYWHRLVTWNGTVADASHPGYYKSSGSMDAPNGQPSTFDSQINAWCATCHSRYLATGTTPYKIDSGDAIYKYRHSNTSNKPCTTCHVAHGSNAQMTDQDPNTPGVQGYSANETMPDGSSAVGDSRLLKVDNRGTCQLCHDPTGTTAAGVQTGTSPLVP